MDWAATPNRKHPPENNGMAKRAHKISSAEYSSDTTSLTIGFRLGPESQQELLARATALDISPHALAREYVESVLTEPVQRATLHSAVKELQQEFIELRDNVGALVNELRALNGAIVGDTRQLTTTTQENVNRLYLQIRELRSDVALIAETLLVSAGKVTEENAQEWVKANIQED
jgi:hypothetical protein